MATEFRPHPKAGQKPGKTNVRPIRAQASHRRFLSLCPRLGCEAGKILHVDNLLKSRVIGTISRPSLSPDSCKCRAESDNKAGYRDIHTGRFCYKLRKLKELQYTCQRTEQGGAGRNLPNLSVFPFCPHSQNPQESARPSWKSGR